MIENYALYLIALGIFSGFLSGLLGIGGGVVIVPALVILFELGSAHGVADITVIAVATSMSCIIFTSASAAYTQYRADKINWTLFKRLVPFFVLGSFCAGLIAPLIDAGLLRILIGVFLTLVATVMVFDWQPSAERPLPSSLSGSGIGTGIGTGIGFSGGLISGTAGIAGGNVIVPTLIYFNVPVHNATATSSAMGVPIALFGALGYALGVNQPEHQTWMLGYIDLRSWVWITAAAIAAAPLGVRLAHKIPATTLKRTFGGLLFIVAARMSYGGIQLMI